MPSSFILGSREAGVGSFCQRRNSERYIVTRKCRLDSLLRIIVISMFEDQAFVRDIEYCDCPHRSAAFEGN